MGHQQRNANRAAGIAKNEARIGKLEEFAAELQRDTKNEIDEITKVMGDWFEEIEERVRLIERSWWKRVLRMDTKKEEVVEMPKEEEKKPEPPATPSHRQVVVDRKVPGPKKKGEPDGTKAESREA